MSMEDAIDVTRIYSVADQLPSDFPLMQTRPFRAPQADGVSGDSLNIQLYTKQFELLHPSLGFCFI